MNILWINVKRIFEGEIRELVITFPFSLYSRWIFLFSQFIEQNWNQTFWTHLLLKMTSKAVSSFVLQWFILDIIMVELEEKLESFGQQPSFSNFLTDWTVEISVIGKQESFVRNKRPRSIWRLSLFSIFESFMPKERSRDT